MTLAKRQKLTLDEARIFIFIGSLYMAIRRQWYSLQPWFRWDCVMTIITNEINVKLIFSINLGSNWISGYKINYFRFRFFMIVNNDGQSLASFFQKIFSD